MTSQSLQKVDHSALKTNQIIIISLNILAFILNLPVLAAFVALVMGIGSALHEEMIIDATGKVRNPSFLDYHLVTSLDVPKMIPIIVECPEPEGPYGAKGLGEPGLAPTPAAIGNAVADAIGVRVYDLPLKPENVFWALQKSKKKSAA